MVRVTAARKTERPCIPELKPICSILRFQPGKWRALLNTQKPAWEKITTAAAPNGPNWGVAARLMAAPTS